MTDGPDLVATIDQWAALARQIPVVLGAYYKALLQEGFSREEAFALTLAYQTVALSPKA
ncbi:MAG: hypothetical protein JO130_18470 [Solirubrobacterales bacterium]|nr:hypothetical protein [Solirubrobacterales bacterium]